MTKSGARSATKPAARARNVQGTRPAPAPPHTSVAEMTAAIAPAVLHSVFHEHRRFGQALTTALEGRGTTRPREQLWMARSLGALMRWWGWIEPLHVKRIEEQLLLALAARCRRGRADGQGLGGPDRPAS